MTQTESACEVRGCKRAHLESPYSLGEAYGAHTREGLVLRSMFTTLHNLETKGLVKIGRRSLTLVQPDRANGLLQ